MPGEIDAGAAQAHPWRNRVTRAVGVGGPLELDVLQERIAAATCSSCAPMGSPASSRTPSSRRCWTVPTRRRADRLLGRRSPPAPATTSP